MCHLILRASVQVGNRRGAFEEERDEGFYRYVIVLRVRGTIVIVHSGRVPQALCDVVRSIAELGTSCEAAVLET